MASVTVDVSIDEFDTDELLEELSDRYNSKFDTHSKKEIEDWLEDFKPDYGFELSSVIDKIKMEFIIENFSKLNLEDLQKLV